MNHETEVGALLLMVSGFLFYHLLESSVVGAVLVAVGAWAMVLPRVLRGNEGTSG